MDLYTFFRSSAAFRVRIALNLKGIDYNPIPIHFRKEGGQHKKPEYMAHNPQGLVPTLTHNGQDFIQSLAIIEYIDETHPELPKLIPENAADRAQVRAMSQIIACDIHPLNNLRVLNYLRKELNQEEDAVTAWIHQWVAEGFYAYEEMVKKHGGEYSFGDNISLADVCLVPQVFNAKRFECDLSPYPKLMAITDKLAKLDAFVKAAPGQQPDAE